MNFKDYIPFGKENKKTSKEIMKEAGIFTKIEFENKISEIRKEEIVLFDNGYFIPNKKEEVEEFLEKCRVRGAEVNTLMDMAYKKIDELEELENGI